MDSKQENFLIKANEKYGTRPTAPEQSSFPISDDVKQEFNFDYSEMEYINTSTKIKIKCIKHNHYFKIEPFSHLRRIYGGCNQCRREGDFQRQKLRGEKKFLVKVKERYGTNGPKQELNFDYSEMEYINNYTKIKIKCIKHNHYFKIEPYYHLKSVYGGCNECRTK